MPKVVDSLSGASDIGSVTAFRLVQGADQTQFLEPAGCVGDQVKASESTAE